jgi:small GTP-binding protein
MNNTCKVVLVGDAGTGKTCIITRFINNRFDKSQMTTACPSFCTKSVNYPEYNKTINLDIWDTAGQEIYRSISKLFYKGASVGILVYDITSRKSFESIKDYWYNELKDNTEEGIIFNLVGNKEDLYETENVKEDEAKEFAKSINAGFYLTSAKSNSGIEKLFIQSGMKFIDPNCNLESLNNDDVSIYDVDSSDPKINDNYVQKKKKCC